MSDASKLKINEIRAMNVAELKVVADSARKELVNIRLDIYNSASVYTGKVRKLRKNLARVLTVLNDKRSTKN